MKAGPALGRGLVFESVRTDLTKLLGPRVLPLWWSVVDTGASPVYRTRGRYCPHPFLEYDFAPCFARSQAAHTPQAAVRAQPSSPETLRRLEKPVRGVHRDVRHVIGVECSVPNSLWPDFDDDEGYSACRIMAWAPT